MAGQNINIGTFSWDTNKIENQIAANRMEMQKYGSMVKVAKDSVKEASKEIAELDKRIESETKKQERLNDQLEKGYISQERYNSEIEKSNEVIDELVDEQIKLSKAQADHLIIVNKSEQAIKDLRLENNELNKLLAAGRTELSENESAYRDLNKELNALKTEAKNLGAQMVILEQEGKQGTDEYKKLAAQFAETSQKADNLNDKFKAIDKSVGDNQRSVGDYKDAITSAFSEITQGASQMASGNVIGGFEMIKNGFKGISIAAQETMAFLLANPITAILVGIAAVGTGIYLGIKEIFKYNESVRESIKLTTDLTGYTGQMADDIRVKAQALADTFGGDFNEVLETSNILAKQLHITFDEAFNAIEQGYVRGANANGDFLDKLGEYAPLLAKYGFDINEIIGLQVQAQQQGLFNDKFEDSLKEAGISLEEFTKAQSDALTSAFGKDFSDKISKDINSGVLSVKDALILMAAEANKRGLSVQQFGILTADVFKGAGEDVGGTRVIFENLYEGIKKLDQPLTTIQQRTLDLSKANLELAKAKDEALKSDKVIEFQQAWEIAVVKVQTLWYDFVGVLMKGVSWIDETLGISESFFELYETGQEYIAQVKAVFNEYVDTLSDLFDALGLNDGESKNFLKTIYSFFNPLKQLKLMYEAVILSLKAFQEHIYQARINAVAFVNTVKTTFSQLAAAIKNFDITKPMESLRAFTDINIDKTFEKAKKNAKDAIAFQKTLRETNKSIQESLNNAANGASSVNKKSDGKTQAEKDAEAKAAAEATKKAEAERKKADAQKVADAKKAAEEAKKAMEAEAKRSLEISRQNAEQSSQVAKSELAKYIANNAEKYKDDKTLLQKKLQDQLAYWDEVKKLQSKANEEERKSKEFAIQQKIDEIEKKKVLNQNDHNDIANLKSQISVLNSEYATKEIELTNETNSKKKELNKKNEEQILEQKKLSQAIGYQQQILALEKNGDNEYAVRQVQLDQETQQKLEAFFKENELLKQLDEDNYISNQEIELTRKELQTEIDAVDDENERLRLQNQLDQLNLIESTNAAKSKQITKEVDDFKLQSRSQVLSGLADLFGKESTLGKIFAGAQIVNDTTTNASKAFTQAAVFASNPLTAPLAANAYIQGGIIIATGAAQLAKLVSPKGFADGGLIMDGVEISRSNGDNRLITAKDGEVILNEDQQEALGGSSIFKMIGVPGFATGGVVGKASNLATVQNSLKIDSPSIQLSDEAVANIANAIYSGSQSGISDLSENKRIANEANF
jgi:hypothetical protein